jgi:N-acetylglucosamine-6-phosphate deacetylase
LIDLGKWLGAEHKISEPLRPEHFEKYAGLPPGEPGRLYDRPLTARGAGLYYADTGVLVGSRLLAREGLARLVREFRVPVANAVAMATLNPARLLGFSRKGALLPGYDADVALFSQDFTRCSFLCWEGTPLFEAR